jgi:hypothetical protein
VTAKEAGFSATTPNTMYNGAYTFMITPSYFGGTANPTGYGFMSVTNDWKGNVTYSGSLPDGTKFKSTVPIAADGTFAVWAPLNSTKYSAVNLTTQAVTTRTGYMGSFIGWASLAGRTPSGTFRWLKPAVAGAQYYPDGFGGWNGFWGTAYVAPPTGTAFMGANETIYLNYGSLLSNISIPVGITSHNGIVVLGSNTYGLSASFNRGTGVITGSFKNPSAGNVRTQFSGLLYQPGPQVYGWFKGSDQYGLFTISP